jgi:uncharacterized damage-inducible protein DinB
MPVSHTLLPEFDQEMAHTRKTLERIPDDKFSWKPHERSMTLGRLATHVAEIPGWARVAIEQDSLDLAPPGAPPHQPAVMNSRQEILDLFDKNSSEARAAIAHCPDDRWMQRWSLLMGGQNMFTMPRTAVVRGIVLNHLIHHRAQLGVYLRLNDIPVPSIYGPSADEGGLQQSATK